MHSSWPPDTLKGCRSIVGLHSPPVASHLPLVKTLNIPMAVPTTMKISLDKMSHLKWWLYPRTITWSNLLAQSPVSNRLTGEQRKIVARYNSENRVYMESVVAGPIYIQTLRCSL